MQCDIQFTVPYFFPYLPADSALFAGTSLDVKARFYDMAIRRIVADFGEVQDWAAECVVYKRQDKTPQVDCTTCEIFLIHAGPHWNHETYVGKMTTANEVMKKLLAKKMSDVKPNREHFFSTGRAIGPPPPCTNWEVVGESTVLPKAAGSATDSAAGSAVDSADSAAGSKVPRSSGGTAADSSQFQLDDRAGNRQHFCGGRRRGEIVGVHHDRKSIQTSTIDDRGGTRDSWETR